MKIIRVICFILLYVLSSQFYDISAQAVLSEEWVSSPSDTSYQSIINKLEKEYQLSFSYSPNILDKESYFRTAPSKTLDALFKQIFTNKEIEFEIVGERRILLYKIKKQIIRISGVIRDIDSKESIPAAFAIIQELDDYVVANDDGYFYIETEGLDSLTLIFNSIGYSPQKMVKQESVSKMTVELVLDINSPEIIITPPMDTIADQVSPSSDDYIKRNSQPGLSPFGLPDIKQQIMNKPMVQNGSEGQSGFVVKGGSVDQNLILVDGMPIYDISHIGGLSSIFITSAVKEVKLFTAGHPAEYGGKLSSVMDVKINEGNTEEFEGEFTLGLTGAEAHFEGPLVKNKTAISLSGRYNDLNFLSDSFFKNFGGYEDSDLNFYDVYAKLHHKFSPTDRISLTLYKGNDQLFLYSEDNYITDTGFLRNIVENKFQWGNELLSLQWNKLLSDNVFMSSKLGVSNYSLTGDGLVSNVFAQDSSVTVGIQASSAIQNIVAGVKFDIYNTGIGKINFGANAIRHSFEPDLVENTWMNNENVSSYTSNAIPSNALEVNGFVENTIDFTDNLSFRGGLHISSFSDKDTSYFLVEPRAKVSYKNGKHLVDLNISINHQYVHFLSNPGIGLPSDIWVPTSKDLAPSESQEVSLGYAYAFSKSLKFEMESYFKFMQGLKENIASSDVYDALLGESLTINSVLTSEPDFLKRIEEGRGYSVGAGGALKYDKERVHFLLSYTYSYTKHLFPSIQKFLNVDENELFFARNHRPHDLFSQLSFELTTYLTCSVKYVYGTGRNYTFLDGRIQGPPLELFSTGRNNKTFPDYHHLDLSLGYEKLIKNYKLNFNIGLYNAYNRKNIFYSYLNLNKNKAPEEIQFGLLPRLPNVTFRISY